MKFGFTSVHYPVLNLRTDFVKRVSLVCIASKAIFGDRHRLEITFAGWGLLNNQVNLGLYSILRQSTVIKLDLSGKDQRILVE
jgi:hypothetical protein